MKSKKTIMLKVGVLISYLGMIVVNFLANYLPIAGKDTGELSDSFPNLFTPAGITFSIWGLIYLLLGAYVVYYLLKRNPVNKKIFNNVAKYFILSSLANIAWIFTWHYGFVLLSVLNMLLILISLAKLNSIIKKGDLSSSESFYLRLPFSIYLGWISVATIANITALFVSLPWLGLEAGGAHWARFVIILGAVVGILKSIKDRNIPYLLVFVWAYFGIYNKHTSSTGFNNNYPIIINIVILSLICFVITAAFIIYKNKKEAGKKIDNSSSENKPEETKKIDSSES